MEVAGSRGVEAVAEFLEHAIVIKGIRHRSSHSPVGKEMRVDVPAKVEAHPFSRGDLCVASVEIRASCLRCPEFWRENHFVDLARFKC